jgi:hypothetical protein
MFAGVRDGMEAFAPGGATTETRPNGPERKTAALIGPLFLRARFRTSCLAVATRPYEQVGGDINVLYLVREWMPCRTRNKMANFCEAYVVI